MLFTRSLRFYYEELDENDDPDEAIVKLRGTIGRGDCLYCGAKNAIEYEEELIRKINNLLYEER